LNLGQEKSINGLILNPNFEQTLGILRVDQTLS